MRSTYVVVAVVVAVLGTLAAIAAVRLGSALGQVEAIGVRAPRSEAHELRTPPAVEAAQALDPAGHALERETLAPNAGDAARVHGGDAHIQAWLVANPEFMRAAEELLQEPDSLVRDEARQLLRDLGAAIPEDR